MNRLKIAIACAVLIGTCWACETDFDRSVKTAVEKQLATYPQSTLKDIYKHFFQDRYGPGHLVNDTAAAARYLRYELANMQQCDGLLFEPTGAEGNFYRVNLSLIRDSIIPYPLFFDLFVRSVQNIPPMPIEDWQKEWEQIERVVTAMNIDLPDFETERAAIKARLDSGIYVGHHSARFEQSYQPHYRIISRKIVEDELAPRLPDSIRQQVLSK